MQVVASSLGAGLLESQCWRQLKQILLGPVSTGASGVPQVPSVAGWVPAPCLRLSGSGRNLAAGGFGLLICANKAQHGDRWTRRVWAALALRGVWFFACTLRQELAGRQVNGSGINQRASEWSASLGCGAAVLAIGAVGNSQFCSPRFVRWLGVFGGWRALLPVGNIAVIFGCGVLGGTLVHGLILHSISNANKRQQGDGFYVTATPSLQSRACGEALGVRMTKSRYLRLSLFAPLVVLALAPPIGWVVLVFTGLPYICFSFSLFFLTRASSERKIWLLSLVSPFLFFPFIWIYWLFAFEPPGDIREALDGASVLLVYVIVAGYAFVGLVHLGAVFIYRKENLTKGSKATPKNGAL